MKQEIISLSLILLCVFNCWSQDYTLTGFQAEYQELENYQSLQLETFGDITAANKVFDLGFSFPYFDEQYDEVQLSTLGIISIEDEIDYSIRLLDYNYTWDAVWDTTNIISDIRYKYTVVDDQKALAIQFTRMRLNFVPTIEGTDSHVTFQYWLYEDGTIEFVMGPYDLSESPAYVPGEGFFLLPSNSPPLPFGASFAVYHPTDPNRRYSYEDFDSHEEFTLRNDAMGSVDWMPPEGWMFRFTNLLVSTVEDSELEKLTVYPNPATDQLHIASSVTIQQLTIVDHAGREVLQSEDASVDINISSLPAGLYVVHISTETGTQTQKFMKL